MFFIPLNQPESVELVIHALRAAGGEADCTVCPARRVCMKQCLTVAAAVERMLQSSTLPVVGEELEPSPASPPSEGAEAAPAPAPRRQLKLVK
ncbi:MAG: hypothetical protein IH614_08175 [Desulfuromonadales bacterium]|nr:hypothetical protein [Desulfuromonadales bacterium]